MLDKFRGHPTGTTSPALGASLTTRSDTTEPKVAVRAVTIGTQSGTIVYIGRDYKSYATDVLPVGT